MDESDIKRSLDQLVPHPSIWEGWSRVQERVKRRRRRRRFLRAWLAPALIVLVLLTLARHAISWPFAESPMVVISDQVSPAAEGGDTETTPVPTSLPVPLISGPAEASPHLAELLAAWQAKGLQIQAVEAAGEDPWDVSVKVPGEAISPPDGTFAVNRLIRTAFVLRAERNMPLDRLTIVSVDPDLVERIYDGPLSLQHGLLLQPEWDTTASMDEISVLEEVETLLQAAKRKARVEVNAAYEVLYGERTVRIEAEVSPGDRVALRGYIADVLHALFALNRDKGAHVSVVTVAADAADGRVLVRGYWDYVTGVQGWSGEPDLMPPWWDNG